MSGRYWTPYEIEIVLHHHCSHARFERWTAPAYEPCVAALSQLGVLSVADAPDDGETSGITVTPLGEALIEMWLQTPLPRFAAIDPRDGKEVMTEYGGLSAGSYLTASEYRQATEGLAVGAVGVTAGG
jgi:hypothetical protein